MRSLFWIPLTIVLLTAAAWAILRGVTGRVPMPELLSAAGITIVAVALALTPMILTRHARQGAVSQAGLVGTVLHLFLSITLAGAVYMMKLVPNRGMFLFLLVAFYWVSLVLLVTAAVRAIRQAEPEKRV